MIFWLDAHLDPELAPWLGANFKVIVKTLDECGLRAAKDHILFDAARRFGQIVMITKDEDFLEFVHRKGAPPQVLWLNIPNMATIRMQIRLREAFPAAMQALEAGNAVVEITMTA